MSEKRKNKPSNLKYILIACLLALFICLGVTGFYFYRLFQTLESTATWLSSEGDCLDWWGGAESREAIEIGAGLQLPESAENIEASSIAFQDCSVNLSFSMDASELESFLASTYVTDLVPYNGERIIQSFRPNYNVDWQFDEEAIYLYGKGQNGTLEYQDIVIDTRNPERYIVYVITALL